VNVDRPAGGVGRRAFPEGVEEQGAGEEIRCEAEPFEYFGGHVPIDHFVAKTLVPGKTLGEVRVARCGAEQPAAVAEERLLPVCIDDPGTIVGKPQIRAREVVNVSLPAIRKNAVKCGRHRSKPFDGVREPRLKDIIACASEPFRHAFEDGRIFSIPEFDVVCIGDFVFAGDEREELGFRYSPLLVRDEKTIAAVSRKGTCQTAAKLTAGLCAEDDVRNSERCGQGRHAELSIF
jgi:hypothetical protein